MVLARRHRPLVLREQRATVDAAIEGVCIAFWTDSAVRPLVGAGKLVVLLEWWAAPFPGFSLYYAASGNARRRCAQVDHFWPLSTVVVF